MIKSMLFRKILIVFFIATGFGLSHPIAGVLQDTEVTLSAFAEPNKVPLNRPLSLTVRLSWLGDLDRFELGNISEPIMTNLEIVGTSSTHRVTGTDLGNLTQKEIVYTLHPTTLGMAYIEQVGLEYEEKVSGKVHHLMTQRIGVEVLAPVPERERMPRFWMIFIPAAVVVLVTGIIIIFRSRSRQESGEELPQRIIEEHYLDELKTNVDLKNPDRREALSGISRIFRKYLSEKFQISALEITTEELIHKLTSENIEEGLVRKCESLFRKADVVKFSGADAAQSDLDESYTTVETILESQLTEFRRALQQEENEQQTKRKRKNVRKKE